VAFVLLGFASLAFGGESIDLLGDSPGGASSAVTARFLADANTVPPGGSFRVGTLLTLGEGWHVYWRNPGDAGLATDVSVTLPKHWSASPIRWPTPLRFAQAGGIAGFGYEGKVLLWRTVNVSPNAPVGETVTIPVRVDWLACRVKCVPGNATGTVTVRVTKPSNDDQAAPSPAGGTFAAWQKRLPHDPTEANAPVDVAVRVESTGERSRRFRVRLTWTDGNAPRQLEWFPPADRALSWGEPAFRRQGTRAAMTITVRRLKGRTPANKSPVGLVAWSVPNKQRRSVRVVLPLAADKPATEAAETSKKPPASTQPKGSSP
jgi:thiol:disulfide interchange protein DsbD